MASHEGHPIQPATTADLEKQAKEIKALVLAARNGDWKTVWKILGRPENPRRGIFVNVIPEDRRWGLLHQAIYWKSPAIVEHILRYKTCDSAIPTKVCTFDNGEVGTKKPTEIAKMYGYANIQQSIERFSQTAEHEQLETFQSYDQSGEMDKYPLMMLTIAAYKNTFHPNTIRKGRSLIDITRHIFNYMQTSDQRWKAIKDKVLESIEGESEFAHGKILKSSTRLEFYSNIILCYTEETSSRLYASLNTAMRRQRSSDYRPSAKDLALGPFILTYQILLLHWGGIERASCLTYRRMKVNTADLQRYQPMTRFVWVSFISSTSDKRHANVFPTCGPSGDNEIFFTIYNNTASIWQPRNIEKYASYVENERTYPAGAKFLVTGRETKGSVTNVTLQLIN